MRRRSRALPVMYRCDLCGKLVATALPIHDCTPPETAKDQPKGKEPDSERH